ncbi:MAG: BON domain-containing protein [Acidobacteriaceae bacterium]|nr:BON domain-containing protein [Acidobacteriaceae bacterium]
MKRRLVRSAFVILVTAGSLVCAQQSQEAPAASEAAQKNILRIAKQVQSEILKLPQYGVFDDIHFGIKGEDTVILRGQASRPVLKSSAENVVKKIEGVKTIQNEIEVLPVSPNDDRIRAAVYYRIYSQPTLQKYTSNRGGSARMTGRSSVARTMGITNDPPIGYHAIHIIVKNGNVNLKGVVNNNSDSAIAEMQANQTPGVFSVDNDLYIATQEK